MDELRVAVVGCGVISGALSTLVYPALAGGASVVATVDPRRSRAEELARTFGCPAFGSLREALSAVDVDAVDVRVPHHHHASVAEEALRAGCHVLVEKPMAADLRSARGMAELADDRDLVLAIAENYAFLPAIDTVRSLLADGAIGHVLGSRSQRVCDIDGVWTRDGWRNDGAHGGRGVLLDQGCHHVDFVRRTLTEVAEVHAVGSDLRPGWTGDDTVSATLRLIDGTVVQQYYCWGSPTPRPGPEFAYYGTEGSIEVHVGYGVDRGSVVLARHDTDAEHRCDAYYDETFAPTVADWVHACRYGSLPKMGARDGLADLAVVEAGYRSMSTGRSEPVESTGVERREGGDDGQARSSARRG